MSSVRISRRQVRRCSHHGTHKAEPNKPLKPIARKARSGLAAALDRTMTIPDIRAVSGDYVQGSFTLLPQSGERASAALFFARLIDSHARGRAVEVARWYFRAAISEFRSTFDLLPADLRTDGLSQQWDRSEFKTQLEAYPLISILKKVRNFAVHSVHVRGFGKDFPVTVLGDGPERQEDIPSIFVETLDRGVLGREINDVSDEDLIWFNRQIAMWPAHLLIQEAIYQTSIPLHNFLATARRSAV